MLRTLFLTVFLGILQILSCGGAVSSDEVNEVPNLPITAPDGENPSGDPVDTDVSSEAGSPGGEAADEKPDSGLGKLFGVKEDDPEGMMDRFRMGFKSRLDRSADWADGLLGTDDFQDRPEDTYGRMSANLYWQNREGFKIRGRFRVRVNLDSLNHRFNAMIGKGDPQDLMTSRYENSSRFASFYQGDEGDEFLAGVGYTPDWASKNSNFSIGGGLRLTWPPAPYINLNFGHRYVSKDEKLMVNFYQTFYYRTDEGLGSTTTIIPEFLISDDFLVRWSNTFNVGDEPKGLLYESYLTVFQDLGRNRALAYEAGIYGETDRVVQFINYGASITYRQQVFREWMYGEVTLGMAWPRESQDWNRMGDLLIGVGFEFFFGDSR